MNFFGHFRLLEVIETPTKRQFQPLSMPSKRVWANILSGAAVIERPHWILEKKTRLCQTNLSSQFFIFISEYQQWTDKFVKLEKSLKKSNPDDNQLETHAKLLRDAKTSRDVQKRIRTWLNEKFTKPLRRM